MKSSFVAQSIWVGNMKIQDEEIYLELTIVNNEDQTDVECRRIVDLDATLDEKRFAQFKEFYIKPFK